MLSKIAIGNGHGENSPYFDGWKAYETDPYHPTKNPKGVIQMGLAENLVKNSSLSSLHTKKLSQLTATNFSPLLHMQLCFDLVQEWVLSNPGASICTAEGVSDFRDIAIFQDYHGLPEFRNVRKCTDL